jgi:hypothetical protein
VLLKYIKKIKDKTMPGMKKMPQDKKDYKSKAAMKDGQDTLNTMQPRKGGIYMDREDGALPQDRVAKYYQETNPKQDKEAKEMDTFDLSGKGYVGRDLAGSANEVIRAGNKAAKKLANNPIPRMGMGDSGYIMRDIKSGGNEIIDAANKGLNYLFGK